MPIVLLFMTTFTIIIMKACGSTDLIGYQWFSTPMFKFKIAVARLDSRQFLWHNYPLTGKLLETQTQCNSYQE